MATGLIGRTAGRLLVPFIFIFGFYIVSHGHLTPGGGFQGGAVIATGVALLLVSYYSRQCREKYLEAKNFKLIEAAGLLFFICTALAGIAVAASFFYNWLNASGGLFGDPVSYGVNAGDIWTAGTIPLMNFAIGIEVFAGLSVILLYMFSGLNEVMAQDEEEENPSFAQTEDDA